jgi:universal stress protein E
MKQVKNILVIVDPTAGTQPAVTKALQLAKLLKSRVELFVCDYRSGLDAPAAASARANLLEHRRGLLEEIAALHRKAGLDVAIDAAFDNPLYEGLLKKIVKSHADLVVKDTHYHNLMRRTLITNTDWHLIRSSPLPLLLVKPTHWSQQMRALAAVDPGHTGDKPASLDRDICEWTATLASLTRGEAHAVHMYFPSALLVGSAAATGMPMTVATGTEQQLMEDERRTRMQSVQEIATPYGIAPDRIHLMLGTAVDLLIEEAERVRADVVVMGAVSRSRLQRIFIGNTAERVLDHLPCDVLIVKPPDFASDLPF